MNTGINLKKCFFINYIPKIGDKNKKKNGTKVFQYRKNVSQCFIKRVPENFVFHQKCMYIADIQSVI